MKFFNKMIASVPPELQEEFDNIQLVNSIRRIRILTVIALISKIINTVFIILTKKHMDLQINDYFSYIDYSELAVILFFNLAVVFLQKSNYKKLLWVLCYLIIASFYILYELMNYSETANRIQHIFFVTIFLFTILPDFKPMVFISFAVFYASVTGYILFIKNEPINIIDGVYSRVLIIFLFIIVTKILLYNNKVKTFVNTYSINKLNENLVSANTEIEKQKSELQNYNENLEMMVQEKTKKIVELENAVMETIAELVERRDDATGGHITRTSGYLKIFIDEMAANKLFSEQVSFWNKEQMVLSAQLHDVGKIAIDDSILKKPGKLEPDEFEKMKTHTVLGGEIIKDIQKKTEKNEFLDYAFLFAVYHHEKWDGSGYPFGIAGEKIPLPSRLMAIIDVYDALISERPYKKAFSHEEAVNIIKEGKGTHFDPSLIDLFLSVSNRLNEVAHNLKISSLRYFSA